MNACAVTGHRPTRFKWKYQEDYSGCKRLKKRMREQFEGLYQEGVRRFKSIKGGLRLHQKP